MQRITIPEIKNHPWFLKNLPIEMTDEYQQNMQLPGMNTPEQSLEEVTAIIQEARKPGRFLARYPPWGAWILTMLIWTISTTSRIVVTLRNVMFMFVVQPVK